MFYGSCHFVRCLKRFSWKDLWNILREIMWCLLVHIHRLICDVAQIHHLIFCAVVVSVRGLRRDTDFLFVCRLSYDILQQKLCLLSSPVHFRGCGGSSPVVGAYATGYFPLRLLDLVDVFPPMYLHLKFTTLLRVLQITSVPALENWKRISPLWYVVTYRV